jgi:hypothetical protein
MRRGRAASTEKIGGAWQRAATRQDEEESEPWGSPEAGITANTIGEKDRPCTDEGCAKGACIDGMVLQQSMPW